MIKKTFTLSLALAVCLLLSGAAAAEDLPPAAPDAPASFGLSDAELDALASLLMERILLAQADAQTFPAQDDAGFCETPQDGSADAEEAPVRRRESCASGTQDAPIASSPDAAVSDDPAESSSASGSKRSVAQGRGSRARRMKGAANRTGFEAQDEHDAFSEDVRDAQTEYDASAAGRANARSPRRVMRRTGFPAGRTPCPRCQRN